MNKLYYKNIKVVGCYPYKALYQLEDGRHFVLCIADGRETKKDVLSRAKQVINYMNNNNVNVNKNIIH